LKARELKKRRVVGINRDAAEAVECVEVTKQRPTLAKTLLERTWVLYGLNGGVKATPKLSRCCFESAEPVAFGGRSDHDTLVTQRSAKSRRACNAHKLSTLTHKERAGLWVSAELPRQISERLGEREQEHGARGKLALTRTFTLTLTH
jgi:hypothetical protein